MVNGWKTFPPFLSGERRAIVDGGELIPLCLNMGKHADEQGIPDKKTSLNVLLCTVQGRFFIGYRLVAQINRNLFSYAEVLEYGINQFIIHIFTGDFAQFVEGFCEVYYDEVRRKFVCAGFLSLVNQFQ